MMPGASVRGCVIFKLAGIAPGIAWIVVEILPVVAHQLGDGSYVEEGRWTSGSL
jgi:hypothetical protein